MPDSPVLVVCPGCATDLRVPAASLGKTIHCPVCRRPVAVPRDAPPADPPAPEPPPAPLPAESPPAPAADDAPAPPVAEAPPADPVAVPADPVAAPAPPAVAAGRRRIPLSTGIAVTVMAACALGVFLAQRPAVRGEIPEAAWKAVEMPGLLRAKLPGEPRTAKSPLPGTKLTMVMSIAAPDKESEYAVGVSEGVLPVAELGGKVDPLVDQFAQMIAEDVTEAGGKEEKRAKLGTARTGPGREVVLRLPEKRGKMVYRVYLIRGRVYLLMAVGPDLDADHPNVTRLFRSFEPLDGAVAPPPPPGDEP
ncbi:hypothetical protein J0H58_36060 [bacterium]|nr:hypothetical protein [bacterium]